MLSKSVCVSVVNGVLTTGILFDVTDCVEDCECP